jgi:phosphopantetheine adenylyltransferase
LIKKCTEDMHERIEVVTVEGLLADFVLEHKIDFQIRGIRSYADFDSEFTMGIINRRLS